MSVGLGVRREGSQESAKAGSGVTGWRTIVVAPPLDDERVWATWEITRGMTSCGWSVEVVGPNGYDQQAVGHTDTYWGAKRKIRRYVKQFRREALAASSTQQRKP